MKSDGVRMDHRIIYDIVEPGSRVLDLGCGDGALMHLLATGKGARVQGIELAEEQIYKCVKRGVSVFHSDIDTGLSEYPDKSFDYIILNQSLQETRKVEFVLNEALRVGRKVIVGFSNFAYYKARIEIFFHGRAPVTESLPHAWYSTPNLHFLSIRDFESYCADKGLKVLARYYLGENKTVWLLPNLLALNAIFVISAEE
ncbi:MAG TPA: methionine biosynthesis protein MetW [Dissulfurispiraceae bacterium]|nr:methionine biosynthesis protein MetW [Dissulfurispiraceae bacterium]